jgi:hypothetical protein
MTATQQTLCALSVASQLDVDADLEWWMRYQIPCETLHLYHEEGLEVKKSALPRSLSCPSADPGKGLFTKIKRKAGEVIVSFPGYWMEENVYGLGAGRRDHYAFSIPRGTGGWGAMHNLIYVTHPGQANYINAAKIGDEVPTHCLWLPSLWRATSYTTEVHVSTHQVMGKINVRFEFGDGCRPSKIDREEEKMSTCLIKVIATMPIKEGAELLCDYGEDYWKAKASE